VLLALAALWLAVRTGWLPADSPALFVAALTLNALPGLAAHARSSLGEAWRSDCAAAARLLGVARLRLAVGYVLPLAAAPLVTLAGISFGRALSGSLVMEVALGWPGLGALLMDAIQSRDTPVVAAVVGVSGAMLVTANVAADTLRTLWNRRLPS
jgi:ABC-type dipeptide/oligopeptide/nickel transport system permease component